MKGCIQLQNLERWRTDEPLPPSVRAHLDECADCRNRVRQWSAIETALQETLAYRDTGDESSRIAAAKSLMAQVRHSRSRVDEWFSRPPVWVGAAVIALMLAFGLYRYVSVVKTEHVPQRASIHIPVTIAYMGGNDRSIRKITKAGHRIQFSDTARQMLSIADDRIGMDAAAEVTVVRAEAGEVRLALTSGKIACDVSQRHGNARFVVQTGGVQVEVIGTRFSVFAGTIGYQVAVLEGVVQVYVGKEKWRVLSGEALNVSDRKRVRRSAVSTAEKREMERLLNPHRDEGSSQNFADGSSALFETEKRSMSQPSMPSSGTYETSGDKYIRSSATKRGSGLTMYRNWILDGEYEKARSGLAAYLKTAADDKQAWLLLADCERKARQWRASVNAYRKVMSLTSKADYRRASYRAASILQDELNEHHEAIVLLEKYLASASAGDAVRPEAMLRLARSYIKVGETKAAKRLIEQISTEYVGTPAAAHAQQMNRNI